MVNKKMTEKDMNLQNHMINKISVYLEQLGEELHSDKTQSPYDKVPQVDVLLHTLHFLQDIDENVQVLNDYWIKKRAEQRYAESNIDDIEH